MYPGITLYPKGGAFMLCESVAEFDENAPPPVQEQPPVETLKAIESCDPVIKMISSLSPIYENEIKGLMNMGTTFEDTETAIANLENVISSATAITNALQRMLGKLYGLATSYYSFGDVIHSSFNSHLGYFMKNSAKVRQQGIGSMTYEYSAIPAFRDSWDVRRLVGSFANSTEVYDQLVFGSTLCSIVGDNNALGTTFDGLIDMLNCLFENPERMARLESREPRVLEFNEMLRSNSYADLPGSKPYGNEMLECPRIFFVSVSPVLRKTCQTCYETICQLVDDNLSPDVYADRIKPMAVRWVNIFGIGVAVCMLLATRLRYNIAEKKAVDDYANLLINTLKTV